jgi:class 3 adenylate cyclase
MLALYRSGRQAEALEAYQQGRSLLSEELGLEPSRRLRELQQAILNQDPALDASVIDHESETAEEARTEGDEPARELRKTISVLHVHAWMSSADGGPLDPEALRLLAESFAGLVEQAAERHGGSVEIRTGDAATAVFGLPAAHEDDARRAVRAALDVRAGLHDQLPRDARMDVRMAVATGEVIAGGGRTIGEPLSAAARLAMSAESGGVLLDSTSHRLLRHVVTVEDKGGALDTARRSRAAPRETSLAARRTRARAATSTRRLRTSDRR